MSKAIDKLRMSLLKEFGTNSVLMGTDIEEKVFGFIPTGSISLDLAIGGGIPIGRLTQIAGGKSTSKSSLSNHIISNAQKLKVSWKHIERKIEGGREVVTEIEKTKDEFLCAYLDVEGTQTREWMQKCGLNLEDIIYVRPSGLEETLEMAISMQKQGVNLIVIDSIDALEPVKELDKEIGENMQMGIKQKLLGEYCRKFTSINNKLRREGELPCTVIFLNQLRDKIGVMYGDTSFTPGGKAIEFYTSLDLRLRRGDWIIIGSGENKRIIGQTVKFKSEKNKLFKQQQTGSYDFYFDDGGEVPAGQINVFKEVVVEAMNWGVIERAGSYFKYKGENIAQGLDKTLAVLKENKELFEQIKTDLFTLVKEVK